MDPWLNVLLFACVGAALISSFLGQSKQRPWYDRRLARIERRLQLIMERLDIAEPEEGMNDVIAQLEQGNKIAAIKIYREETGAGLKEAKTEVEMMARERGL